MNMNILNDILKLKSLRAIYLKEYIRFRKQRCLAQNIFCPLGTF